MKLAKVFHHPHRVTYAECTAGNHVYYGRYLDILEEARGEFFRSLGKPLLAWQENDTIFPVIECRLRYLSPARYDDCLSIRVWLVRLEGVRLAFGYDIRNETDKLILEAEITHVCTTLQEKPKRVPVELKAMLADFLKPVQP